MTQTKKIIQQWIMDVQDEGRGLTKWEERFIESIIRERIRWRAEQFDETGSLSDRQEEILERIRAEKTP